MSRVWVLRVIACLAGVATVAPAAWGQLPLTPNNCASNSVLPSTYQFYQEVNRWMGVAVSPQNPAYSVQLEMLAGPTNSYSPAVLSTQLNGTNFLMRTFAGVPDAWCYAKAFSPPPGGNAGFVAQWDPGSGPLAEGGSYSANYGGLALQCELLRVFDVFLTAGQSYTFTLTTSQPLDDIKLAVVRQTSRPDGWASRQDALFEKQADPVGSAVPHVYTATATGNHGLAVFLDDMTAFGGTWTLGFDVYTPPAGLPDLVVDSLAPTTAPAGTSVTIGIAIRNIGNGPAGASTTQFVFGGGSPFSLATPALAAGAATVVHANLGVLDIAGQYTMTAVADQAGVIAESFETNNSRTETFTVTSVQTLPDLVVNSVTPASAVPSQPFTVYANLYNRGTAGSGASTTRLELNPGGPMVEIATPPIDAGATYKVQGVMVGVPAGQYTLRAVADCLGAVTELSELNNIRDIAFQAIGPDLVVESISPLAVVGNVAPVFTIAVRNLGNGGAVASSSRLAVDGLTACLHIDTPPVPAGGAVAVQCVTSTILSPGNHTVDAYLDVGSVVLESNENNNHLTATVSVTPSSVVVNAAGTGDYPTIQAAVDAVAPGGEVLLAAGTYTGAGNRDITFRGKNVSVVALPGGVIINCQGDPDNERRAFRFVSGETPASLVRGVTIIGGWSEYGVGGGILISGSAPTLEECVIHACHADKGGAIACSGSPVGGLRPQLTRCTLTGNSANLGAAAYMEGTIGVMMDNVLIASNYGYGGAVAYGAGGSGTLDLDCCDVWNNGGGDYVGPAAGQLGIDGNISQNPLFCDAAVDDFHLASNSPCAAAMYPGCGRIGALDAACGPLGGTVRRVEANGSGPYATIQQAINGSVDGDIVELGNGVYIGTGNRNVSTLGKAILVRSASGDPYACRLDAQNAYRGFEFNSGEGPTTMITGIGIFNGAAATGAGILCSGASPSLINLYIADCNATDDGGGLCCTSYASPTITGCRFENNSATDDGGGLYAATWCSPEIDDCVFSGNLAGDRGGGAVFSVNCFPTIDGTTFRGNEAANGGGLNFTYAYGPVTDCVFLENISTYGGGYHGYGNARADFRRCTFSGNTAANGANVYLRANSSPTFTNCIIAFGVAGAAFARYATDCNPVLACTDVWGNAGGDWTAMISDQNGLNGNFWADPLFCDRLDGVLTLRGDSPCAMVNNSGCGQVGALPVGCSGVWLVRPDGSGDFSTIQAAIDAAVAGETIVLADGVFTGSGNRDLDFKGKAITMRSQSGDATACIIDCQGTPAAPHFGVNFVTGETPATVLQDVTIRGAYRFNGAGGRIDAAHPTLRRVIFRDNKGDSGGGLILANGAAPWLEDCVFQDNAVTNAGGGLYANASFPQLVGCAFRGNTAYWGGGGLYCQRAAPNVVNCTFDGNASSQWGGAVHARYVESAPSFSGCLFTGNTAPQGGALYGRDASGPSFTACTFSGNASANGAVLHGRSGSTVNVIRGLLVFSPTGATVTSDGTAVFNLLCSDVYGNVGGDWTGPIASQASVSNNFSADPVFCNRWGGVHTLASISPCAPARSPCGQQVGALGEGCVLSDVAEPGALPPVSLVLEQNVPNPFNPMTTVTFATPRDGQVEAAVYALDGRRVTTLHSGPLPAGRHELVWRALDERGRAVASGIYLVRVRAGEEVLTRKMMLLR